MLEGWTVWQGARRGTAVGSGVMRAEQGGPLSAVQAVRAGTACPACHCRPHLRLCQALEDG